MLAWPSKSTYLQPCKQHICIWQPTSRTGRKQNPDNSALKQGWRSNCAIIWLRSTHIYRCYEADVATTSKERWSKRLDHQKDVETLRHRETAIVSVGQPTTPPAVVSCSISSKGSTPTITYGIRIPCVKQYIQY